MAKEVILLAKDKYLQLMKSYNECLETENTTKTVTNEIADVKNETQYPEHDNVTEKTTDVNQTGGGLDSSNSLKWDEPINQKYIRLSPVEFYDSLKDTRKSDDTSRSEMKKKKKKRIQWVEFKM